MAKKDTHKAGAFDIRNVIGGLIGLYAVILLGSWLLLDPGVDPSTGVAKDATYNLWTGLMMAVVAIVFFAWAKMRPIIVPDDIEDIQ